MPISSRWTIPIPPVSLPSFLFTSPSHPLPQTPLLIDADRPATHYLTYASFRLWSQRFAAGLVAAGLQPGDRVLLFAGNNVFFPVAFMGILMAGGVFTGANPGYVERELAYQLSNSGASFLLCADASLELGISAASSVGMSRDRVFVFDDRVFDGAHVEGRLGVRNWRVLLESEDVGRAFGWKEPRDPKEEVCCLNYSSGTTGVPKGVVISHNSYVANAVQYNHLPTLHPEYEERTKKANWLCFVPMYHAMGQTIFITCGPKRGIPVYIMKKFDFVQMLESVQKFKISSLIMVPPIVVALAKSPLTKNYDLSSVEDLGSGAAPLGGDVVKEAEALWPSGQTKMKQGWGMTEATCSILGWDPTLPPNPSSVGELNANCSARIMDADGQNEVPAGERGEIWVQGPTIMKGYWENKAATDEMFVDDPKTGRWMRTGDIAYVDPAGLFYIVDRLKELIKVRGNQVAPAELEGLLLEHPALSDACVVGVTIRGEEVPRAYVVLRDGEKGKRIGEEDVKAWLAERVSRTKRLEGGVVFVDVVPKNPSGKILRQILRERAKEEVGDRKTAPSKL
ncbi:4-coumarate-CoA ligase [Marssonina coronariae]|uniref:4-coumarate-CoA ligase n=1 Tax=Diplocarpon coronariae TaxID=2795749 RepID=A0A218YWJ1_9HELO|nr:4-coumarate-CoA ligase [Marssonina coronariae]